MSKAYLLVICLLAVSFTGCMSGSDDGTELPSLVDDETNQEDDTKQEEETEQEEEELIDPVGEPIDDSSTDCNCTVIVEDESYDPEYFSSVWLSNQPLGYWNETGVYIEYSDVNEYGGGSVFRGFFNKTGNNVHITPIASNMTQPSQNYLGDYWYKITIYGPDELYWEDYVVFFYGNSNGAPYLHEVDIELPWEPVGFTLQNTDRNHNDLGSVSTNGFSMISITRPF